MMERIVWSAIGLRKAYEFIMTRERQWTIGTSISMRVSVKVVMVAADHVQSGNSSFITFKTVLLELSYCVTFRVAGFAMMKTKSMVCI